MSHRAASGVRVEHEHPVLACPPGMRSGRSAMDNRKNGDQGAGPTQLLLPIIALIDLPKRIQEDHLSPAGIMAPAIDCPGELPPGAEQ